MRDCWTEGNEADWSFDEGQAKSFDDLKSMIARGIPVVVEPSALTPFAHPTDPTLYELGVLPAPTERLTGNLAGVFLPLEAFTASERHPHIRQDLYWSARLVVGYDESDGTVTIHDPTFGPFWELSLDLFDAMWKVGGRSYVAFHPKDYDSLLASGSKATEALRCADDDAAVHYVFGYALSATGRNEEAEAQIRKGLALKGITKGYRFLLLLELAVLSFKMESQDEAIALATEASTLFPKLPASWALLAGLRAFGPIRTRLFVAKAKRMARRTGVVGLPRDLLYSTEMARVTGSRRQHG